MAGFLSLFKKPFQKDVPTSKSIGVGDLLQQRYRLEAELGRGGMGLVYRAKDIQNEREVAVKVINPATANALTLGQFTREAEITSRLNHPHIVKVFETNTLETETPYIVMELVKGKSSRRNKKSDLCKNHRHCNADLRCAGTYSRSGVCFP